ncbi:hypothetical protein L1887_12516 [Cichorium endivia]|nr:hypothetical protein L1887_12516 [Cichorium endivia]
MYEIKHNYIEVDGLKLHIAEIGYESSPPVVFLHGFPEIWWMFKLSEWARVSSYDLCLSSDSSASHIVDELGQYADNDPATFEAMKEAIKVSHEAANRWTAVSRKPITFGEAAAPLGVYVSLQIMFNAEFNRSSSPPIQVSLLILISFLTLISPIFVSDFDFVSSDPGLVEYPYNAFWTSFHNAPTAPEAVEGIWTSFF